MTHGSFLSNFGTATAYIGSLDHVREHSWAARCSVEALSQLGSFPSTVDIFEMFDETGGGLWNHVI